MHQKVTRVLLASGLAAAGVLGGAASAQATTGLNAESATSSKSCRLNDAPLVDVTKVRGNRFTTSEGTFRFDRNDNYATGAEGERISYAQFRRQLSVGDSVQVFRYCTRRGGKSGFALFNDATPTPPRGCRLNDAPLVDVTQVRGNRFTTSEGTFRFDRNDEFNVGAEGDRISYARFKRNLSVGDSVQVFRYCTRAAGKSSFALFQ